jgi:hypothetical protein
MSEFSGRKKHRGLYVSKNGFAVNADVNVNYPDPEGSGLLASSQNAL